MTQEANVNTDDAVALFRAGGTVAEVATLLGVDETPARRALRAGGVKAVPCRRVAQVSLELIVLRHRWAHLLGVPVQYPPATLYGFGADIDTIVELTGLSVEQVRSILIEDGEVYEPPAAGPSPAEQRARRMVEARCDGRGLADIGDEYGGVVSEFIRSRWRRRRGSRGRLCAAKPRRWLRRCVRFGAGGCRLGRAGCAAPRLGTSSRTA